jgi:hypothetical protein
MVPLDRASLLSGSLSAPSPEAVAPVSIALEPGRVTGLIGFPGSGLTRLALSLLATPSRTGMVAVVDVRGWLCPVAAWEVGIDPERLVVIRCSDRTTWPRVTAALVEGFPAVYAEVPRGIADADLRRLGALARSRRSALALRPVAGDLPGGVLHLRVEAEAVVWQGVEQGHGALLRRRLVLRVSGKGAAGIARTIEVDDEGSARPVVPAFHAVG